MDGITDDKANNFENTTKRQTPKMTFVYVLKQAIRLVFYFFTKKKKGLKRLMMNRIIPQIINKPNTGKKKLETAPTRIPIEWMMPWSVMNKQNRANIAVKLIENFNQISCAVLPLNSNKKVARQQPMAIRTESSSHLNEVQVLI